MPSAAMPSTLRPSLDYATFCAQLDPTLDAMRLYGGGFLSALANALARADDSNRRILFVAFADKLADYGPGGRFFHARHA
jgi:hypothetical protein